MVSAAAGQQAGYAELRERTVRYVVNQVSFYANYCKDFQAIWNEVLNRRPTEGTVMQKKNCFYKHRQEAQLPQRDSASATHVFLGSLTDRALHWAPHLLYNYIIDY